MQSGFVLVTDIANMYLCTKALKKPEGICNMHRAEPYVLCNFSVTYVLYNNEISDTVPVTLAF